MSGEVLDGTDLNPAAVLAVAQGEVGVAAAAQVSDGERHVAGDLPRVDVGLDARTANAQAARPASARLPVSW